MNLKNQEEEKKEIIKLFLKIMGDKYKIKAIEKLGGMNNKNYKIYTNIKNFVFRLPGKGSNESVNRESEIFNIEVACKIGLDCKTIYFNSKSGLKITEYIQHGETFSIDTAKMENNMELMAYALNTLHNSKEKFYNDFKPFIGIKQYKNTIIKKEESLLQNYIYLDKIVNILFRKMEEVPMEYVPSHLDAWPENFVKGEDKIYLIDWEYSANYDRLWDVASISLECEYSKDKERLFLSKYFNGKTSEKEIEKMNVLKVLMDMYWSMWALSKVSSGDRALYKYSYKRYKRGVSNFNKIKRR